MRVGSHQCPPSTASAFTEHAIGLFAPKRNGGAAQPVGARIAGKCGELAANARARRESEIEQPAPRETAERGIERDDVGSDARRQIG